MFEEIFVHLFFQMIFDNSHLKFKKVKKTKIKKQHFRQAVNRKQNFFTILLLENQILLILCIFNEPCV